MADEVYQENIWKDEAKFISCRKVAFDLDLCKWHVCREPLSVCMCVCMCVCLSPSVSLQCASHRADVDVLHVVPCCYSYLSPSLSFALGFVC